MVINNKNKINVDIINIYGKDSKSYKKESSKS